VTAEQQRRALIRELLCYDRQPGPVREALAMALYYANRGFPPLEVER
jgi:hypothetical protein